MRQNLKKDSGFNIHGVLKSKAMKIPAAMFLMQAVLYAVPKLEGIIASVFHSKRFIFLNEF
jgi:hypothetical protein